ncbi:hypothetical protein DL96DRAFT_1767072 [Flagelloscypha sp. PMI_526]|nr:hypothetical protein DL96DRAFT_1767072 [Flagelloscypha sp. PMI_526]
MSGDELGMVNSAKMRSAAQFQDTVSRSYLAQYGEDGFEGPGRQIWHMTTVFFRTLYDQLSESSYIDMSPFSQFIDFPQHNFVHDQIAYSYSNLILHHQLGHRLPYFRLFENSATRNFYKAIPFSASLTRPELISTRLLRLHLTLLTYFPCHGLLSDFLSFPDTVPNTATPISPAIQTRVQGKTVTTESYLVQPGWCDIFSSTDFEGLREMSNYWALSRLGDEFFFPRPGSSGSSSCGGGVAEKGGRRQPVLGTVSATGLGIGVGERKSGEWGESYG